MADPPGRAEQLHDEHRRKVWEDLKSGSENFDKYMVTLSSGALGVSLSFVKDVVPLKEAVCVSLLIASRVSFVICILITLISFRLSIHALEEMLPCLDAYYLRNEADAFNKHLKSFSTRAVDWCANLGIIFFVLGLIFTMMFVGANVLKGATHMNNEHAEKIVTGDLGKAIKPVRMTPVAVRIQTTDGISPVSMTPVISGEDRGLKTVPMTPVQPVQPAQSVSQPVQPGDSGKK
jgi:hypothetical protein